MAAGLKCPRRLHSSTWHLGGGTWEPEIPLFLSPCASGHVTSLGFIIVLVNPKDEFSSGKSGGCRAFKIQTHKLPSVISLELHWPKK